MEVAKIMVQSFAALLFCNSSFCQEVQEPAHRGRDRFFLIGLGITSQSFYDEAISDVRYSKTGFAPIIGHIKETDRKYSQLLIEPSYLNLTTKRSDELRPMKVSTLRLVVDYQQLFRTSLDVKDVNVKLGGLASLILAYKEAPQLDNSALVYDYALSVGVAGRATRQIRLVGRDCHISYQVSIPLVSHITRPQYLNRIEFLDTENNFIGDAFSNSKIVTPKRFLRINSQLAFTYHLNTGNDIRIGYHWDFYRMNVLNTVYAAEHLVSLSLMFKY